MSAIPRLLSATLLGVMATASSIPWRLATAVGAENADGVWTTETSPPITQVIPPARWQPASAIDPVAHRLVVFGGQGSGSIPGDVWTFDLSGSSGWTQIAGISGGPGALYSACSVYDSRRHRMVVCTGSDPADVYGHPNARVWSLSLDGSWTWSDITPAGAAPKTRVEAAAVYDSLSDRIVLTGGVETDSLRSWIVLNDTWSLDLGAGAWSQLAIQQRVPPERAAAAAAFDAFTRRIVLFGGYDQQGTYHDDAWVMRLDDQPSWAQLPIAGTKPEPRAYSRMCFDQSARQFVLYGGAVFGATTFPSDVWGLTWSGGPHWRELTPRAGSVPSGRAGQTLQYDPANAHTIVFAGENGLGAASTLNDTWSLRTDATTATWDSLLLPVVPYSVPGGIDEASMVAAPPHHELLIYGGRIGDWICQGEHDPVWCISLSGNLWSYKTDDRRWQVVPRSTDAPPGLAEYAAVYDSDRDRMLIFGGYTSSFQQWYPPAYPKYNDVWAFSLVDRTWTHLAPEGTPPSPRSAHCAVYDPVRNRLIAFGGQDDQTWELWLDGTPRWEQIFTTSHPPVSYGCTAVYDPIRDRMVLVEGHVDNHYSSDVWSLNLAGTPEWTQLAPLGSPPIATYFRAGGYEPAEDRMVLYNSDASTWSLALGGTPTWSQLSPAGDIPSARYLSASTWDAAQDALFLYGGTAHGYNGDYLGGLYSFATASGIDDSLRIDRVSPATVAPLTGQQALTLHGSGFRYDMTVAFVDPSGAVLPALVTSAGGSVATVAADFGTAERGMWDVEAARQGVTATLTDGLRVSTPPRIVLLTPDGGETMPSNETSSVRWTFTPGEAASASVSASLSMDDGVTYSIDLGTADASAESVLVTWPESMTTHARVRLVATDAFGLTATTSSAAAFAIAQQPHLSAVSPIAAPNTQPAALTLMGTNFSARTQVELHSTLHSPLVGFIVTWTPTRLVASVDLTGIAPGSNDLWVRNLDGGLADSLIGGFTIADGQPSATVLAPNGGEVFPADGTTTIAWASHPHNSPIVSTVVDYTLDGGATYRPLPQQPAPGDSTLVWQLPHDGSDSLRVRVTLTDSLGVTGVDESDAFAHLVLVPQLADVSPVRVSAAASRQFTIHATDGRRGARLMLTRGDVAPASAIVTWMGETGVATLDLSHTAGGAYDAVLVNPGGGSDTLTNAVVVAAPAQVVLLSPNGNEKLLVGTTALAQWRVTPGDIPVVRCDVALSLDAGATFPLALGSTGGSDSILAWTVPLASTKLAVLRVTLVDSAGVSANDTSDQTFQITGAPGLTVNAISPAFSAQDDTVWCGIQGSSFLPLPTVYLSSATDRAYAFAVTTVTSDSLWVGFHLTATPAGTYDVIVESTTGDRGALVHGFTVYPQPDLQWISPEAVATNRRARVELHGSGFADGMTASLTLKKALVIDADSVTIVTADSAIASFNLAGVDAGYRTVVVRNRGGRTDSLSAALTISVPPLVLVQSPNGGESMHVGELSTIRWSAAPQSSDIDHVDVWLSSDDGVTFPTLLAGGVAATDSALSWMPANAVAFARVRVSAIDIDGVEGQDESDGSFSITDPATAIAARPTPREFAVRWKAAGWPLDAPVLELSLPVGGVLTLDLFDTRGARCMQPLVRRVTAGTQVVSVPVNTAGKRLASGVYLLRATLGHSRLHLRLPLLH